MKLDRGLAQKIVYNTMEVLGKNINIMNHNGIIIGSGDKNRINDFHEIAAKVINCESSIIIDEDTVKEYKGVKEGINLPIKFQGDIIGVVGITGKYEVVADFGEIVKNMVELILKQEFLRKEIEIENKARETFFQQVISNNIGSKETLNDRARLLNIKLNISRVVILIKLDSFNSKQINNEVKQINDMYFMRDENDIAMIRGDNIVLIKSFQSTDEQITRDRIRIIADDILESLKRKSYNPIIAIGQTYEQLNKIHLSYKSSKRVLQVSERIYCDEDENIYSLSCLRIDYFLPVMPPDVVDQYLHHLANRNMEDIFNENNIEYIIEGFVNNNMNVTQTARNLNVHRNTLLYNLNKIEDLTGLNPKDTKDLFALFWAYHLYLYKG